MKLSIENVRCAVKSWKNDWKLEQKGFKIENYYGSFTTDYDSNFAQFILFQLLLYVHSFRRDNFV